MTWLDQLLWPVIVLVSIAFTVLVSFLLANAQITKRTDQLEQDFTTKIRLLNNSIANHSPLSPSPAETGRIFPTRPDRAYAPLSERKPERSAPYEPYERVLPADPRTLPSDHPGGQDDAAAAALADRDTFRNFVDRHGGTGHVLQPGGGAPTTSESEFYADLWAISCPGGMLVYPGYNLRRTQSSLVADSGRVAEERLGWLYDIETGSSLRAIRPAMVATDWSVTRRGVLQVPF